MVKNGLDFWQQYHKHKDIKEGGQLLAATILMNAT
jgi:hypothetical protein